MASASPLPPPLDEGRTRRLAALRPGAAPHPPAGPPATLGGAAGGPRIRARTRRAVKKALRRTLEVTGGRALADRLIFLHTEMERQREQMAVLRAEWVDLELRRAHEHHLRDDVERNRINLELLKGELRHLQHTLEELGRAFAPTAGLAGAASRFAELRESVNGLERRLRNLSVSPPTTPAASNGTTTDADPPPSVASESAAPTSTLFNYVGFERRFRGDPEQINTTLVERYGDLLTDHQPVVDIGCGRAELLETLAGKGVEVIGVEPDPGMVAEGRARGVTVHQALAGHYLRSVPDHSLGSIITTHVVEHLPLDALIEMLELSVTKLRPGGVFVAETPNPATLIVLGTHYIMDPTHVWPLHPSLLSFLCESAGFRDISLQFFSPATEHHLAPITLAEDTPDWARDSARQVNNALEGLNKVLFGHQDYAVIATTPA